MALQQSSNTTSWGPRFSWLKPRLALIGLCVMICLAVSRLSEHALVAVWGLLALLAMGILIPVLLSRLLRVELTCQADRGIAGDPLVLAVRVSGWLPKWMRPAMAIRVQHYGTLPVDSTGQLILPNSRRGVLDLSAARLIISAPFGLIDASRPVSRAPAVTVWPRCIVPVITAEGPRRQCIEHGANSYLVGDAAEMAGVRSYRRGDRLRTIHWAQTARQDRLMVREQMGNARRILEAALDLRFEAHESDEAFESAVSLCAGLAVSTSKTEAVRLWIGEHCFELDSLTTPNPTLDALAIVERSAAVPARFKDDQVLWITSALQAGIDQARSLWVRA
jgi:uncharacterized protein (DUF58 family)